MSLVHDVQVVYEDDCLLVVNKPPRLPVHATLDKKRAHLQGVLEHQRNQKLVLFHRLDVDTTGLVVFGKDPSINFAMNEMFRTRDVSKTYWAVVDGRWDPQTTKVETYIKKVPGGKYCNLGRGSGGDHALTHFRLIESIGEKSWLECKPHTGRTHQIRLHCLFEKHPILGDPIYGRVDARGVPIALHARQLEFKHPKTAKSLALTAELPDYWKEIWLSGFATDNV